ncbi:helix-turn-helix domain-containing protein [[Kitasatospora] papulosa]|uniref:helix-turn-helix domain-containing protein n=1 Tax=[Kitasatospora] papulosa TaxID=1464011 RepID=UPI0002C6AAF6|nr:putative regulatory protein [Streptomyces sp. PAMC 26508]
MEEDDETQSTMAAVGPRLKGLRTQRSLSLTALAEATGISLSTFSRLESGKRRSTLELLLPMARELRVDIGQLIGAPQTGDPRLHLQPVTAMV